MEYRLADTGISNEEAVKTGVNAAVSNEMKFGVNSKKGVPEGGIQFAVP